MLFARFLAVSNKLIDDIKKIAFATGIIVQCIFFAFYCYSIYTNLQNLTFLIIYSFLFALSIAAFINYLIAKKKKLNSLLKSIKYLISISLLVVRTYEYFAYSGTFIDKIFLVISLVSLIAQALLVWTERFIEKYVELYTVAFQNDLKIFYDLEKLKEHKGNFYEIIDAPFQAISNKIQHNQPQKSKAEQIVEKLTEEYKEQQKIKKKEKKERIKERSNQNAEKQKQEIKEHLNIIKNSITKKK